MKHSLLFLNLCFVIMSVALSQNKISIDSSLFSNGIKLESPGCILPWRFELKDLESKGFKNFEIHSKSFGVTRIKFDSILLFNGLFINHAIVSCRKRKTGEIEILQFGGIMDFNEGMRLVEAINYHYWGGVRSYPKMNPFCGLKLWPSKDKKSMKINISNRH